MCFPKFINCVLAIYNDSFINILYSHQISVLDAAGMGEVLETFVVSSTAISCISAVPQFDGFDPDVLSSE